MRASSACNGLSKARIHLTFVKQLSDFRRERLWRERFLNESDVFFEQPMSHDRVVCESGHVKPAGSGPFNGELLRQLATTHARHHFRRATDSDASIPADRLPAR